MIRFTRLGFIAASLTAAVVASNVAVFAQSRAAAPMRPLTARPYGVRPLLNSTARSMFVAGGATLPALGYEGVSAKTNNPSAPSSGSLFAYFASKSGVTTMYCQTGSGFGKRVYDGDTVKVTGGVNGPCAAIGVSPGSTNGFGAPASLGLTQPDITGSDIPLAQSEYSNFVTNKSAAFGEPVSFPSIIGSIAFLYNYAGVTLALTDSQICSIVEGKVTNWSTLGKAAEPLTFVYRSDGSGTTFSLSNHLTSVCGTSSGLSASQNFDAAGGGTAPFVIGNANPANFIGESGNQGVANYVASHPYSIGYVETANALGVETSAVRYATVNGKDPVKNLPETAAAITYTSSTIAIDNAIVTNGGAATLAPLTGVKKAGCVQIVKPSTYANITKGYPIVAVTNLLFNSNGNGATNATNLRGLVTILNTPSLFGKSITLINSPTTAAGTGTTGYVALGSTFNSSLESAATSCIGT